MGFTPLTIVPRQANKKGEFGSSVGQPAARSQSPAQAHAAPKKAFTGLRVLVDNAHARPPPQSSTSSGGGGGALPDSKRPREGNVQATRPAQNNSHIPHGSVPSGARPPPQTSLPGRGTGVVRGAPLTTALANSECLLGKRKEAAEKGEQAPSAAIKKVTKVTIPSFSLDDSDASFPSSPCSQDTVNKEASPDRLGQLVLEVAGVKFYKKNARESLEGTAVQLVREPTNKYDANAMKVVRECGGREQSQAQIGHVPRNIAAMLAPLVDSGQVSFEKGVISKIQRDNQSNCKQVEVLIEVLTIHNVPDTLPPAAQQKNLQMKREELMKILQRPKSSDSLPLQHAASCAPAPAEVQMFSSPPTPHHNNQKQQQQKSQMATAKKMPRASIPSSAHPQQPTVLPGQRPLSAQQQLLQKQNALIEARELAQQQQLKMYKKQKQFDALNTEPLEASVSLEQLLDKHALFPAPPRWENILKKGAVLCQVDSAPPDLWKLTKTRTFVPSSNTWQPKDDIASGILRATRTMHDFVADAQDIYDMDLFEMRQGLIEQHSKDMRASIRESLAQAQRLCVRKELLHEALLTADKERHHKHKKLMVACGHEWVTSLRKLSSFDDDVSALVV